MKSLVVRVWVRDNRIHYEINADGEIVKFGHGGLGFKDRIVKTIGDYIDKCP